MNHEHSWVPVDGEVARYACACGREAWRNVYTGRFREVSTRRSRPAITARPMADEVGYGDQVTVEGSSIAVPLRYERVRRKRGA